MTIYNWLCLAGVPALVGLLTGFLIKRIKTLSAQNAALMLGMQALLRDRLYEKYDAASTKGFASLDERRNFENIYLQYHTLGANGVMDDIHRRYLALPVIEEETRQ